MVLTPTIKQKITHPKDIPKDELKYETKATMIAGKSPIEVTILSDGKNFEILSRLVPFIAFNLDILNNNAATMI